MSSEQLHVITNLKIDAPTIPTTTTLPLFR